MSRRRRESPIRRTNPSGESVWVARYTSRDGRRRSAGTFKLKREAQAAIDAANLGEARGAPETVGAYFQSWTTQHLRSERTNRTNEHRVSRVLDVEIEGRRLSSWPFRDLKRRHALELVDHMLAVQGRAADPQAAADSAGLLLRGHAPVRARERTFGNCSCGRSRIRGCDSARYFH